MARHVTVLVLTAVALLGLLATAPTGFTQQPPNRKLQENALQAVLLHSEAAQRAKVRAAFARAFQAAEKMTVEQRLKHAAASTARLRAKAEKERPEPNALFHPRREDLVSLYTVRPWLRAYRRRGDDDLIFVHTLDFVWPTQDDAAELRRLVRSANQRVAAMAIEALATLHVPQDVSLIARELGKQVQVTDIVLPNLEFFHSALPLSTAAPKLNSNPLEVGRHWVESRLGEYAERALHCMTGYSLTEATWESWLAKHGADRNSLWHWQTRMTNGFDRLDFKFRATPFATKDPLGKRDAERQSLREHYRRELAALSSPPLTPPPKACSGSGGKNPLVDSASECWRRRCD